jgi:hypothetical protein
MLVLLQFLFLQVIAQDTSNFNIGFLQLSVDARSDDSIRDQSQLITILLINLAICLTCCGVLQIVIILSKRMTSELIVLRKNYKQYQGLLKFREFKKAYNQEIKT